VFEGSRADERGVFLRQLPDPISERLSAGRGRRCALCRYGLRGFDAAYCFGSYEGVLRELIHLYKYGRVKTLARPLGALLAARAAARGTLRCRDSGSAALAPAMATRVNQSELLARTIARRCGIPVIHALKRVRPTVAQAGLSNTGRRQNVAAAFRPRRAVEGKRILLVDDVMTTGSTAASCALALKRAGASKVALLTVARVDRRLEYSNDQRSTAEARPGAQCQL